MRLLSLHVENYGIFADRSFDFGSGRFQLICGANEAGKSTLLQLVREMLFGFPHQNPFKLADGVDMAATAKALLADGRELRFRRRKGRKDVVVGELDGGQDIGEPELAGLLGGAGLPLFQSVFAFSLSELASGQQSLEQADLTEALFGGAIGGLARFKSLRERIQKDAADLFTVRPSKRVINTLLAQARELADELQETAARPAEYQQLVLEHREHQEAIERHTRQLKQLRNAQHEASRMCDAWAPFLKLRQLKQQRVGGDSLQLSAEQWEQAGKLRGQLQQLGERIEQQGEVIRRRQLDREQLGGDKDTEILAQQNQVQALVQDMGRMQGFAEELPRLQRDLAQWTERVRHQLRDLELHWDPSKLEQIPDDGQMQQRLLRTASDLVDTRRQTDEAQRLDQRRRAELEEIDAELQLASTADPLAAAATEDDWDDWTDLDHDDALFEVPGEVAGKTADDDAKGVESPSAPLGGTWESIVDLDLEGTAESFQTPEAAPLTSQQQGALEQLREQEPDDIAARRELAVLLKQREEKASQAGTLEAEMRQIGPDWSREQAPRDAGDLTAAGDQWRQRSQELRSAEQSVQEAQGAADALEQQAAALAEHAPPDRDQLQQLRNRRDEAWSLVRLHYVENTPQDAAVRDRFECEIHELAMRLTDLTHAADEAADVRQDQADLVARLAAQQQAVVQARSRVKTAELRREQVRKAVAEAEQRWRSVWPDGPSPGAAGSFQWLTRRDDLAGLRSEIQQLAAAAQPLQAAADRYETQLRSALQLRDTPDLEMLRVELRERLRRHHQWEARREHLQLRRRELIALREDEAGDQRRRTTRMRQLELAWGDLRERMGLPSSWEPESISAKWTAVRAAKSDWRKQQELAKAVETMRAEIDGFRQRVERVAGESDADQSAIETLHELSRRLDTARQSQQQRSAGEAEDKRQADELQRLEEQRHKARGLWEQLLAASGASSEDLFTAGLDGASVHQQLAAAERELHAALGCDDPARRSTLLAELERSDEAELQRRLDEAARRVAALEQQLAQHHKQEGASRDRLRQLDGSDKAASVDMRRQSCLAELSEAVDRWVPLMLAGELMDRALARFERKHQPALLADVTKLFKRMTAGAYVDVRRQLDKKGTLLVVDGAGAVKTPDQLSTGSREQLYLAIRLAYVRHYCRQSEPLPLVMDDVLVNFDEQRARRTIEVLVEMSDDVQILMLTCHRGTSRLVHQICPGMQPLLLARDDNETLDSWLSAPRARRRRPSSGASPEQGVLFPKG